MVNINLLPWREKELEYQKIILKKMFAFAVLLALIINIVGHIILSQQENEIQKRIADNNETLKNENKISVTEGFSPVDNELSDTFSPGKMFSELEKNQKPMTCFTEMKEVNQTILLQGKALSMRHLTEYLSNWKADIKIQKIKQEENGIVQFELELKK